MSRLSQKQGKDRLCHDKVLLCRNRVHFVATKSQGKLCRDKFLLCRKITKCKLCRDKVLLCRDRVHFVATKSQGKLCCDKVLLCHDKDYDKDKNFVATKFYSVAT